MKLLKNYVQNFLNRSGSYVFTAAVVSRGLSFLASWLALQLIPNKELGVVLFAYNIIAFLTPFGGLGLNQSLVRYGALLKNDEDKNNLFVYVFKKGVLVTVGIIILIVIFSYLFPFKFENTSNYLALLSLVLIPLFVLNIIQIQFRLKHNNKTFSKADIIYNLTLVISVLIFSYFYQEKGYIFAIILAPTVTSILFFKKLNINFSIQNKLEIVNYSFWKYGFYSGVTTVVTNLLVAIDIILIGHLMENPEMVTAYKYVSIIPLSLLFISQAFIATDFVAFTEKINDKKYIYTYIKSYMLLFSLISLLIFGFAFLFSDAILSLFSKDFVIYSESFLILIFGIFGILIFRGLFGNLLCSIGKIEVNSYIIGIALIINIFANYYLIPVYGIKGAAITSAILMWFTGLFSYLWFFYLYKKMTVHE
ncbi:MULTISPECIES: polysaccharide biosynthesis C-terminal domain-containing protein [unclassified Polaribacter]|uniref:oligosaccharide flippase family protein n=1 Tax=unclassified Polaribacter TaxID=196858 RepID=UPI0011BF9696|nr:MULTISPECIES: polysaccharide biosynthesis C-terminal domain-containing protein [unclassified Polaribacter]TXD54286.1 oligosaccharide flippase family protein [Polaribacter sp. IC063]TXD62883.1 oligosaccharide flippase family protein [Polaribacter sp. IC066]